MCNSSPKSSAPKFKDPRMKDPDYLAVASDLGFTNKKGVTKIKNARQLYEVDKVIQQKKEAEYKQQLDDLETRNQQNRQEDIARQETQYAEMSRIQQMQFEQSMAAQNAALQAQLEAQDRLQKRAEEMNLRSQVPQFTSNSKDARRVKSKTSSRLRARQASRGANQLRIPLSIGSGSTSPVKLNIGS